MTRGRKREHYQWNLDIIGEDSPCAEAEVLSAAIHALRLLTFEDQDIHVLFSSRAVLSALIEKLGVPPASHQAVFLALDKRGKLPDAEIADLMLTAGIPADSVTRILEAIGASSLDAVTEIIGPESVAAVNLRSFQALLQAYGMGHIVRFDLSVVRGLSYYTGIVFEAYDAAREFRAVFGGGRYDNLLQDIGGKPATAVGLGFGDVVVAELLSAKGHHVGVAAPAGTAVSYMEDAQRPVAVAVACGMRRKGEIADLALHHEKAKAFFSRVGRASFRNAVYVGPDDVAKGVLRLKDLQTRTETEIPLAGLTG